MLPFLKVSVPQPAQLLRGDCEVHLHLTLELPCLRSWEGARESHKNSHKTAVEMVWAAQ